LGFDEKQQFERPSGFNSVYDCEKTNGTTPEYEENPSESTEEEGFF
jgi:hypothetical protein